MQDRGKRPFVDHTAALPTGQVPVVDGLVRNPAVKLVACVIAFDAMSHVSLVGRTLLSVALVGCGGGGGGSTPDAPFTQEDAPAPIDAPLMHQTWPTLAAIPMTSPDGSFWGPMFTIGSQSFMMDLDTGSTTTAVAGKTCTTCASAGVTPLYMPGSTAMDQHNTVMTSYSDGSGWAGEIYVDAVGFTQTPTIPLALGDIVNNMMDFFADNSYQGILGMGAPANAEPNTGSWFDLATQSGMVPIMAFELCPTTGTMWLGGFDSTKAAAAPGYTPLLPISNDQPFYSVDISSMSIGATKVSTSVTDWQEPQVGSPVVDTGTSLFYAPTAIVPKILAAINASAGFKTVFGATAVLPNDESQSGGCITKAGVTGAMVDANLPPLTITFPNKAGGADISYTLKPMVSYMYDGGGNQWCFGIDDDGGEGSTLGDQIMEAFVTIIDVQNQQVGWAIDTGCGGDPTFRRPIQHETFRPHLPHPRPHRHH